jgi:pyridoxamine 5'-phosphate oxidase family protein
MTKESAIEKPATFTDGQKAYITEQRVLRIATVPDDQALDVASVAFRFDGEKFHIGGIDVKSTFK